MKYLALVAALGLTGCCATPPSPAAAPAVAAPCAPVAAKAAAPAAAPFGCNANAKANAKATGSPVAMSTVTMPTPVAKALAVPPGVVTCLIGFGKCLIETLISPLKP